ncbi:MAG: DUF488 domain-containing protein [Pyrinomonas methylaliphatogenes]|uniref:DUF488 domain-containing protein n=2 Tax=Pyrinomonas methylaliphatogenes TaxID=454194 RepID=A0A0B6WSJ4_9BACT|nr:DUF488 domain-containing protein [Pyrinomonas methylaliphatogenes]CDM64198.1 hypothetical protein PYK22_00190 [Pyrinomonas methylaliphatogenes]
MKSGAGKIAVKRVYEESEPEDGARFLVERLWPRGIKKESLRIDAWLKDVAPSDELRRWFKHDPAKWSEFRRRYFAELESHPEAWRQLLELVRRGERVTLLYSARDREHNNAIALKEFLEARFKK